VCGGGLLEFLTVDDDDAIPWKSSPLGVIWHLLEILTILERLTSRRQRALISVIKSSDLALLPHKRLPS
jgi:hypothetical protein